VYEDSKDIQLCSQIYEISEAAVSDALKYERASALNKKV
jgi:hypothetical protein